MPLRENKMIKLAQKLTLDKVKISRLLAEDIQFSSPRKKTNLPTLNLSNFTYTFSSNIGKSHRIDE